ncbi:MULTISPECIES: metal-sensitive transcriptional regulator [Streptomyces]|uniref:Metal-sensitive transcriptional regulator n=1 Tax=Streptomyces decoyicus TaxID=249567 RepID=A0ABZ1FHT2_9ACTN|nr:MULTISPECIES: metal-sensitive transcriptional regulator [Streptomyces]MCL7492360.1 metal-sensitive transcriptional regulator [Streptomyces sp. MCA2]WSB69716.1 metal-sensitive transcriptional regulator [Streptomyces decoyicus]WSV47441.1 metal-sensitive transcriptional regulator [Streptomyces decoyicus]
MTPTDADTNGSAAAAAACHPQQPDTDPRGEAQTVTDNAETSPTSGTHGYAKQKDAHIKRLRRIEGQIRGLQRMLEEDVYCIDILTQVSASTKGLQSFGLQLLEEHLRHCVADAAVKGPEAIDAKVQEATKAIERMLRT